MCRCLDPLHSSVLPTQSTLEAESQYICTICTSTQGLYGRQVFPPAPTLRDHCLRGTAGPVRLVPGPPSPLLGSSSSSMPLLLGSPAWVLWTVGHPRLSGRWQTQSEGLPVRIFGNRARIELKEDDAHGSLRVALLTQGYTVCGKRGKKMI